MGPPWAHAFLTAGLITLVGTPLLRRLAVATDFVDHPHADHKSHCEATPYLGGIGLMIAVLAGLLYASKLTPAVAVIAIGGAAIGCLGLLDDHRSVGALPRFGLEVVVAAVALAVGLRVHATDILVVDGLITIVWIVGVTNAINLLDNMDGLSAGVSAAAAGAIFALAVLNEQPVAAVLAASLAGACLGFGVYNKRPASIFMGDAGSLFLGFVLAVVAMDVSPALTPPTSFVVPVMLLALPVLDTATVTVCRLRRRRSIAMGGQDHLSHRLVARGLAPGVAVAVLVSVEAWVGLLAVLTGRQVISLSLSIAALGTTFATLVAVTVQAPVYREPVVGMPTRLWRVAGGAMAVGVLLTAPAVAGLLLARGPGTAGARSTSQALDAVAAGDSQRATRLFADASDDLRKAGAALHGPFSSLGLVVPGLRANLATTRAVVRAGRDVVGAAQEVSAMAEASTMPLKDDGAAAGSQALAPALAEATAVLRRAAAGLAGYNRPYLWPALAETVRTLRAQLEEAAAATTRAAEVTRVLPAMLGDAGTRRYFLAIQDNTELRGSGGVVHYWGELVAEHGRLRLTHLGPTSEFDRPGGPVGGDVPQEVIDRYRDFDVTGTWQNTNVSPDFEVTGRVITSLYARTVGTTLDGVISVDIPGLAALLGVTGPVTLDGRSGPIDSRTLLDTVVRDAYPAGRNQEAILLGLVRATVPAFTSADLGTPAALARTLGPSVRDGHLRFYATRADEQAVLRRLGATGEVPAGTGDSVLVVNQNLSATSVDTYLHRSIRYDMALDPGERAATLSGRLEVTLRNDLPSAGVNRSYVSMYTPLRLVRSALDGGSGVESGIEFGRRVYSTIVSVPSQQSRTIGLELAGEVALRADGWYLLDVLHQTSLQPDDVTIALSVPEGWRIVEARGLDIKDANHAAADLRVGRSEQLALRLERTPWARLWSDRGD